MTLDCLRGKEYIATNITDFGRNVLNYDDTVALTHGAHYFAFDTPSFPLFLAYCCQQQVKNRVSPAGKNKAPRPCRNNRR